MLPKGNDVCIIATVQDIRNFMSQTPTNRSQITCFRCGEQGHYKSECFHWKTRLCWHYQNENYGGCKDLNCSFAHGKSEIRQPWLPRCIRIIKQDGQLICIGCKEFGHTFKFCPRQQKN